MPESDSPIPSTLTPDEAFRAAFYLLRDYMRRGYQPDEMPLFAMYMWTDPARWGDWQIAIREALADGGLANPDHEGRWQDRPDIPW